MKSRIDLSFRPCLIIFVGQTGEGIRKCLKEIVRFAGLDSPLYQSIALLQVAAGSDRATPYPLAENFSDQAAPQNEDALERLVERALRDVQTQRRILAILEAGYPIPNTRTQIYIVGAADETWLPHVLHVVRQRLEKSDFSSLVCYVLNAFSARQRTGPLNGHIPSLDQQSNALPGSDASYWAGREMANFCYLYEDMLTHPVPVFISEAESYHATAEALFALMTTALTTEPFFEELMRLSPAINSYENVGSLSTSLIVFPHAYVLEFCSSRLCISLMQQWLRDLNSQNLPDREVEKLQGQAKELASSIENWIKTRSLRHYDQSRHRSMEEFKTVMQGRPRLDFIRPGGPALQETAARSPGLLLAASQGRLHRQLREETSTLFGLFLSDEIEEEYKRQGKRVTNWTRIVHQQANKAVDAYHDWDNAASTAWLELGNRINAAIKAHIDQRWASSETGFEQATIYARELDERLTKIVERQGRWREDHASSYEDFLTEFERLAEGPWVIGEDASLMIGNPAGAPAQARPVMGNQVINNQTAQVASNAPAPTGGIIGADLTPQRTGGPHQHLPPREERIAHRLEQRIHWLEAQIPSPLTHGAVAAPFIFSLTLSALAWLPATPVTVAASAMGATLITGGVHLAYYKERRKKVEEAKEDLLTFYIRYYDHRCKVREDKLRITTMGPLRRKVQSIREKLDNISEFICEIQERLAQRSERVHNDLFYSPASVRDIFVANGERLQRNQKNTLNDVHMQINRLRMKEPKEEWHRAIPDMKHQLIARFSQQQESLLEMSSDDAFQLIYKFAESITSSYITGAIGDIRTALDKPDIWLEALDRAENPLYRTQVGMRDPQFLFVCGREPDLNRGTRFIPNNAHPVHISRNHQWVLVAALFRGGLPTMLDTDMLFPYPDTRDASQPPPAADIVDATGATTGALHASHPPFKQENFTDEDDDGS